MSPLSKWQIPFIATFKTVTLYRTDIKSTDYEKLFAIKINSMLNFKENLCNILTKASWHFESSLPQTYLKKQRLMNSLFHATI